MNKTKKKRGENECHSPKEKQKPMLHYIYQIDTIYQNHRLVSAIPVTNGAPE